MTWALNFAAILSLAVTVVTQSCLLHSPPIAHVEVNLERLGWKDVPLESDKSFFKDFSLEKLEARDGGTKLVFLSENLLVAYHGTHQSEKGKDWRTVHRYLEAFFINAKDGTLLSKKQWPTAPRKDFSDTRDSEARLIRVSNDRFLVQASDMLMLYSSPDRNLLEQRMLAPSGLDDLWAVQSVPTSPYLLLRHGHRSRLYATYEWLDADTLETLYRTESYSLWRPVATRDSLIGASDSGIQRLQLDGNQTTICQNDLCHHAMEFVTLSSQSIAFLAWDGVGVVDADQGLLWSDPINPHDIRQVGRLCSAASGERFAFVAGPWKNASFHGEKLGSGLTVLVYDAKTRLLIRRLPAEMWFDCALSPSGTQIALADGKRVKLYLIE